MGVNFHNTNPLRIAPEDITPGMRLHSTAFPRTDDYVEVIAVRAPRFFGVDQGGHVDLWWTDEHEWTLVSIEGRHSARRVAPGQHVIERAGHEVACFTVAGRLAREATVVRALCQAMDASEVS